MPIGTYTFFNMIFVNKKKTKKRNNVKQKQNTNKIDEKKAKCERIIVVWCGKTGRQSWI